ncbi:hypothetical protein N7513_011735 [Penicillium frequentans]|nr:hypothetical protein N7513_011735 [Penicillium glabrum]
MDRRLVKRIRCHSSNKKSPWRNWLARLTVNQEVGSSSLPGDASFLSFCSIKLSHKQGLDRIFR